MLLKGKDSLTDSDNSKLFLAVQDYIHATGRFDCLPYFCEGKGELEHILMNTSIST